MSCLEPNTEPPPSIQSSVDHHGGSSKDIIKIKGSIHCIAYIVSKVHSTSIFQENPCLAIKKIYDKYCTVLRFPIFVFLLLRGPDRFDKYKILDKNRIKVNLELYSMDSIFSRDFMY